VKRDFAFSGLIKCGHCSFSLVGEMKKGRYVYYHCSGFKGKCPEPYTREEILEEKFSDLLKGLYFDDEVLAWITEAVRQSHQDEKRYHDEAIARLQAEYKKLQNRIDAMYEDKLDGRIDAAFFDRKAADWRSKQDRLITAIESHQTANQTYFDEGIRILELAQNAYSLFVRQKPLKKRRLLNFLLSNCTWKGGELHGEFRQPFDIISVTAIEHDKNKAAGVPSDQLFDNWPPRIGLEPGRIFVSVLICTFLCAIDLYVRLAPEI